MDTYVVCVFYEQNYDDSLKLRSTLRGLIILITHLIQHIKIHDMQSIKRKRSTLN